MSLDQARENMVKQQLRTLGLPFNEVMQAVSQLPRESYIPSPLSSLAYAETEIPLENDQTLYPLTILIPLLDALELSKSDQVLEWYPTTGYITTLLSKLTRHVDTADTNDTFLEMARQNVKTYGDYNVSFFVRQQPLSVPIEGQTYDKIIITQIIQSLPDDLKKALNVGGCITALRQHGYTSQAIKVTRISEDQWKETILSNEYTPADAMKNIADNQDQWF